MAKGRVRLRLEGEAEAEVEEADEDEEDARDVPEERPKLCCSARVMLSLTCFVAIANATYVRIGLSMALVCMVVPKEETQKAAHSGSKNKWEFEWSPTLKGYLISAVFYGFILGPFVAGFLSFRFGGKIILVVGSITTGAVSLFLPEAARLSPILFFAVRVVVGFFASFTFPAFYDLVSHWIVPEERQLLVTGALVGIPLAGIVNFPINGLICDSCGWVWLFYSGGIWMILWGVAFCFTVFDYPEACPYISERETRYLKRRIPRPGQVKIPWKKIIQSMPIYAYIVMHFCTNYVYLTVIFSLPLLMEEVHHFPLKTNGLLSATPFMGSFCMRILLSLFFEQLRLKLKLSKNTLRKTFVFLGASLGSLFFLVITFLSSAYRYWVLGCFVFATASLELCLTGGYLLSLLDLCPSYVNILTGATNAIGNAAGLISPIVSGMITSHGTREEWNTVFYVNIAVLLLATAFYLIFGQNHLQYWGLATLPSQTPVPRASLVN